MSRIARILMAVAGAIAAVIATVALPFAMRRRRDEPLAGRVRLALHAAYDGAENVQVKADRGLVTLRGEVDDLDDIDRLEAVARAVAGVSDVDNLLRLRLVGHALRPQVLSA